MKKSVLLSSLTALSLLFTVRQAQAQAPAALVNGGTYKLTHYGVVADNSQVANGVPAGSALVLDIDFGSTVAGTSVGQWGDNGNVAAQRFILERQTDGSFRLKHTAAAIYLQPLGLATAEGTRIEMNVASAGDAQRWLITDPNNNGRYELKLKGTNQVLEIGFASAAPGARVNLWTDTDFEPAQRWVLTLTSPSATKAANALALQTNAYPNPLGRGQHLRLSVEAAGPGAAEVEILDVLGKKAHSQRTTLRAGGNVLGLTNRPLAAGVYVVRVKQGEFVQQTRVVQE